MLARCSTPQKLVTFFRVAGKLQVSNSEVHLGVCQVCVLFTVAVFVN